MIFLLIYISLLIVVFGRSRDGIAAGYKHAKYAYDKSRGLDVVAFIFGIALIVYMIVVLIVVIGYLILTELP